MTLTFVRFYGRPENEADTMAVLKERGAEFFLIPNEGYEVYDVKYFALQGCEYIDVRGNLQNRNTFRIRFEVK